MANTQDAALTDGLFIFIMAQENFTEIVLENDEQFRKRQKFEN